MNSAYYRARIRRFVWRCVVAVVVVVALWLFFQQLGAAFDQSTEWLNKRG